MALIENDLKHWKAVSEFFPPVDPISRNYELKAKLQTARFLIEGENYSLAAKFVSGILDSQYADDVILTIAEIEMGYLSNRVGDKSAIKHYKVAAGRMENLAIEKQKLIKESLPKDVRVAWEDEDDRSRQDESNSSS